MNAFLDLLDCYYSISPPNTSSSSIWIVPLLAWPPGSSFRWTDSAPPICPDLIPTAALWASTQWTWVQTGASAEPTQQVGDATVKLNETGSSVAIYCPGWRIRMNENEECFVHNALLHWLIQWQPDTWYFNGWRCLANNYLNAAVFCSLSPRLETRMTADINVILQLLQRQIAPVPPAYSTVLPDNHTPDPVILYRSSAPVLHSMYPIPNIQLDSRNTAIQVKMLSSKSGFQFQTKSYIDCALTLYFIFWKILKMLYLQIILIHKSHLSVLWINFYDFFLTHLSTFLNSALCNIVKL